jgi:lipoprotein-releasing system ATP-binding protein
MLTVTQVSKDYPAPNGKLTILSGIDLKVEPGAAVSIMGPSGSGKSTLLYILGGLEPPTSGHVRLDDQDLYELTDDALSGFRRDRIGFVFQDHCLLPQCSVLENVLIPTLTLGSKGQADLESRARQLLDSVGLGHRLDHRPGELSGGEKQRCAIARALILRPALLLCDEPTGNLDRTSSAGVSDLLFQLQRESGATMVLVTHSAELGGRCPQRYEMDNQRLKGTS